MTDGSARLPDDLARELSVVTVPIGLAFGDHSAPVDEFDQAELVAAIERGERVRTSAPTPGDFLEAISAADRGDGVVVLTLAASMSSTHQSARLAAAQAGAEALVVDTGTASGGLALIVLAAARAAAGGAELVEVAATARDVAARTRLVAVVGSLQQLARSGRVPALASRAGDALGVRPLFAFQGGQVRVLRPSLRADRARERLVERVRQDRPGADARLHVAVLLATPTGDGPQLLEAVREELGEPEESLVTSFDAAMIAHTGSDVTGLAWWWE